MADLSSLVSSRPVFRASNARKWAMAGAALLCLCAFTAIYQDFRISPVLRSRHALVPDPGLDGPLSPNSATMRNIAPDVYEAQVATSEGIFSIEVKRAWAPHAADRFYNLAANGFFNGCSIFDVEPNKIVKFGIAANPMLSYQWMYGLSGTEITPDSPNDDNSYRHMRVAFIDGSGAEPTTQIKINLGRDGDVGYNPSEAIAFGRVSSGRYDTIPSFYSKYGSDVSVQNLVSGGAQYVDANFPKLSKIISVTVDANNY